MHNPQTSLDSTCYSDIYESESEDNSPSPPSDTAEEIKPMASPRAPHLLTTAAGGAAQAAARPQPEGPQGSYLSSHTDLVPFIKEPTFVARLQDAFRKGLAENTLNTNTNFLEQLFPCERLPFPVNEDLLSKLSAPIGTNAPIWNWSKSCFRQLWINFEESAFCNWLNYIGMTMGLVYGRQCERLWWSGNCEMPLVGPSIPRKPDLVLFNRSDYSRVSQQDLPYTKWPFVKALVELYQTPTEMTRTESCLVFPSQPHRRFTISLSFIIANRVQFSIAVTDRVGQIRTTNMDLMGSSIENGLHLLSILAFLMFGSPEDIGLDPSFEIDPSNGRAIAIECENRRFELVKCIYNALQSQFSRGTQIWIVAHEGIRYIIKDSWVQEDGINNEVAHLSKMKDHKELEHRVPTLICGGDVVINGVKDSTGRYRRAHCSHRVHRRIVTSPVGEPITSFRSKKEFIRVIISIIETHRYLYNSVGILHCNLSIDNVLLTRNDNESEAIGLLIGYGCSLVADSGGANRQDPQYTVGSATDAGDIKGNVVGAERAQSETPRTGTQAPYYMAIEALLGITPTFVHKPQHDLESILYIILYICTFVRGPGLLTPKLDIARMPHPICSWFRNNGNREIGYLKVAHLLCYDMAILPNFAPYWRDFARFVKDLIMACFPANTRLPNKFDYEQVLEILEKAYDAVEEPYQVPRGSEVIGAQDLKRPNDQPSDEGSKKVKRV